MVLFSVVYIKRVPGQSRRRFTDTATTTTNASFNESSLEENFTELTAASACRRPGLRILYFVHTAPKNAELRAWLRKTIGNPEIEAFVNSAIVFFVGLAPDTNQRLAVEEEAAREGDVVVLNFTDTYRNLSLKFIHGAEWVLENCGLNSTTTIVKMDDDVLVNVFALSAYVASPVMSRKGIHCVVYSKVRPVRKKSKWVVTKEEYAPAKYPAYCAGAAFMVRPAVLSTLYQASRRVPVFWVDDVYVTGILASLTKVDMVNIKLYFGLFFSNKTETVRNTILFVNTGGPNYIRHKVDRLWQSVLLANQSVSENYKWRVSVGHRKTLPWLVDWVDKQTGNTDWRLLTSR
ncbi:hypothetical protein V5799_019783 [Amblyomma americanum]|uniref:Hexosyltransferase n=1 Tax=Amblyomma americanum TaxID=6943 RepID=A0AAQ4EWC7_AMBAM